MRPLTKAPKPGILEVNEDAWTDCYVAARKKGEEKSHERWRHSEIRDSLNAETDGKCAYCESVVSDVSYSQVEHIIPKSLRPDLAHRWNNLTSACPRCNNNKKSFYDEIAGIINPYTDQIHNHLRFYGDIIDARLGSVRGDITIRQLQLNRIDLVASRVKRLEKIRDLVEHWHKADGVQKTVLEKAIKLDCKLGEYTATVSAYLESLGFPMPGGAVSDLR